MLSWVKLVTDVIDVGLAGTTLYLGSRVISKIRLNLQQSTVRLFLGAAALFAIHELLSIFGEQEAILIAREIVQTGIVLCLCLAMRQITRSQGSEITDLQRMADTDRLTGLDNLATFAQLATALLKRSHDNGTSFALLMIDIDEFKSYNDQFGHEAGNAALQLVARTLRSTARASDIVARYGGEEFVLLMLIPAGSAAATAERIRLAVEQECSPMRSALLQRQLTISLGVVGANSTLTSLDSLLEAADRELYRAKGAGRNRVSVGDSVR